MSYRSNRVRQMYPIAVRSQDDRPRSVRTTFVGGPFFSWADRFFSEKYGPPGPIFFKKLVLGPKFLPDQNFRDRSMGMVIKE